MNEALASKDKWPPKNEKAKKILMAVMQANACILRIPHTCMHAYTHAHTHIHTHINTYTSTNTYTHITNTHMHIYSYMHTHTHVHMHKLVYLQSYLCTTFG
jgi:hypothetical protein